MELYNGKYCISHAELTDGIMSVANVQWYNKQNKLDVARRGCRGTEALYVVDSLPTKYRIELILLIIPLHIGYGHYAVR